MKTDATQSIKSKIQMWAFFYVRRERHQKSDWKVPGKLISFDEKSFALSLYRKSKTKKESGRTQKCSACSAYVEVFIRAAWDT